VRADAIGDAPSPRVARQGPVVFLGLLALTTGALALGIDSWRHGALLVIGALLGAG
jgi:hypothetical protein